MLYGRDVTSNIPICPNHLVILKSVVLPLSTIQQPTIRIYTLHWCTSPQKMLGSMLWGIAQKQKLPHVSCTTPVHGRWSPRNDSFTAKCCNHPPTIATPAALTGEFGVGFSFWACRRKTCVVWQVNNAKHLLSELGWLWHALTHFSNCQRWVLFGASNLNPKWTSEWFKK